MLLQIGDLANLSMIIKSDFKESLYLSPEDQSPKKAD